MVQSRSLLVLVILLIASSSVFGQNKDRYMVFFSDKEGTPYSVSQPLEFLSQKSLDRRTKNDFGVTEDDLPVNPNYVSQLESAGADVYFTSRWFNAVLVQMVPSLESTIEGLSFVDEILMVAPGEILSNNKVPFTIPETFTNPSQVSTNTSVQNEMLEVDDAHQNGYTGEGILIAVFDGGFTGVNQYSPFENLYSSSRIISELDFVQNSGNPYQYGDHGTRVLSTITAEYGDFTGTAPDAQFILAVTEETASENPVEEYNWLMAAEYADSAGVDIINSSLSYGIFWSNQADYPATYFDGKTNAVSIAANFATDRGIIVVNSAGNDGPSGKVLSPADSEDVLTIASVTSSETKSGFSSVGPTADGRRKPDLAAMGSSSAVVNGEGNIVTSSGTSFSSPILAGFVACILEAYPDYTASRVRTLLRLAGSQAYNPDNFLGYGIPTYSRFVQAITLPLGNESAHWITAYPNPFVNEIIISGSYNGVLNYQLVDLNGRTVAQGSFIQNGLREEIELEGFFEKGLYFLRLHNDDFSETFKLLKK